MIISALRSVAEKAGLSSHGEDAGFTIEVGDYGMGVEEVKYLGRQDGVCRFDISVSEYISNENVTPLGMRRGLIEALKRTIAAFERRVD